MAIDYGIEGIVVSNHGLFHQITTLHLVSVLVCQVAGK